jgi:hypothetical protein
VSRAAQTLDIAVSVNSGDLNDSKNCHFFTSLLPAGLLRFEKILLINLEISDSNPNPLQKCAANHAFGHTTVVSKLPIDWSALDSIWQLMSSDTPNARSE